MLKALTLLKYGFSFFLPWFKLLRPYQYTKNLFVFLPLFFALKINNIELLRDAFWSFCCFSLIASSVYILNDLKDIEEDQLHPKKRFRPMASGSISKSSAISVMILLMTLSIGAAFINSWELALVLVIYLGLNVSYSLGLKHIAILDIFIISCGFILRLFAGAKATNVPLTMWIILITFLLALFLGLAKRRDDILLLNNGVKARKNIDGYNLEFVNAGMIIMASVVIVSYIFYTISAEVQQKFNSEWLYLTVVFVLLGIMRYLQITFVENNSGNPSSILLKDRFLQLSIMAWLIVFMLIIY
jgi:decaprenyl-phosphate phosphoribosyltransferase